MENNTTTKLLETPGLSIVRKDKKDNTPAKLVNLKQKGRVIHSNQLMPPQEEMYIKAKKHDFF